MHAVVDRYVHMSYEPIPPGPYAYRRLIEQRKRAQTEFYAEMAYYELLLETVAVFAPPPTESTTTITSPSPIARPRRGRPPTGGRKSRDRRSDRLSDLFVPTKKSD